MRLNANNIISLKFITCYPNKKIEYEFQKEICAEEWEKRFRMKQIFVLILSFSMISSVFYADIFFGFLIQYFFILKNILLASTDPPIYNSAKKLSFLLSRT